MRRVLYAVLVAMVTSLTLAGGNVLYTNHVDNLAEHRNRERAREICGLITTMDDSYQETPPTTATGKSIAAELHAYRTKLGC